MKNTWKVLAAKRGGADETNQSIHADLQTCRIRHRSHTFIRNQDVVANTDGNTQDTDEYVLFDDDEDGEDEDDEDDE